MTMRLLQALFVELCFLTFLIDRYDILFSMCKLYYLNYFKFKLVLVQVKKNYVLLPACGPFQFKNFTVFYRIFYTITSIFFVKILIAKDIS